MHCSGDLETFKPSVTCSVVRGVINVFSRRATGFHSGTKLFELNFFIRKTFRKMVKPGGQNHPPSWAICPVPGP